MNAQNMANIEPEEPSDEETSDLGLDVPEIKAQFDQEVNKRKFINILIQGAAVNKTHAYHLASERLNEIDPDLIKLYGKMTALGDLSYWMKPEDVFGGKHGPAHSIGIMAEPKVTRILDDESISNIPLLAESILCIGSSCTRPQLPKRVDGRFESTSGELEDLCRIGPWVDRRDSFRSDPLRKDTTVHAAPESHDGIGST